MGNVGAQMLGARMGQGKNIERYAAPAAANWFGAASGGSVHTSVTDNAGYGPFGGSSVRILGTNANGGLIEVTSTPVIPCQLGQSLEVEFIADLVSITGGSCAFGVFFLDASGAFLSTSTLQTAVDEKLFR